MFMNGMLIFCWHCVCAPSCDKTVLCSNESYLCVFTFCSAEKFQTLVKIEEGMNDICYAVIRMFTAWRMKNADKYRGSSGHWTERFHHSPTNRLSHSCSTPQLYQSRRGVVSLAASCFAAG